MKYFKKYTIVLQVIVVAVLAGCSTTHKLESSTEQIIRWQQIVHPDQLQIRLRWSKPMIPGPHPTIVVHPGLDDDEQQIDAVADDLVNEGYLVVVVNYQRKIRNSYQKTLLPLRENSDFTAALEIIRKNPLVDQSRIGALGFSIGGAHSFLMAAKSSHVKAIATYYPMADFMRWAAEKEESFIGRMIIRFVRWNFNAEAEHHNDSYHLNLLQRYSPVNHTDSIAAPVLIVHGDKDDIAPLDHSKELHQLLLNNTQIEARIMVVDNAPHAFGFDYSDRAMQSWLLTKSWLQYNLSPKKLAKNEADPSGV